MLVAPPEVLTLLLEVLQGHSGTCLAAPVGHLQVVGPQHQFHAAGGAIVAGLPALAHHAVDGDVVP